MESFPALDQNPLPQVTGKSFGTRASSYIIDTIIMILVSYAGSFIIGITFGLVLYFLGRDIELAEEPARVLGFLIGSVNFVVYFLLFEWLFGASPGKALLGMRVVMENGAPCTFTAAFVRGLLRYVDGFFFALPAYSSMKEPLHQRIGDKRARTLVVGAREGFIQRPQSWWFFLLAFGAYLIWDGAMTVVQFIAMMR